MHSSDSSGESDGMHGAHKRAFPHLIKSVCVCGGGRLDQAEKNQIKSRNVNIQFSESKNNK